MKKALIIGATGFGGLGLIDLLIKHPEIQISELSAIDYGKKISQMYPHLKGVCDLEVLPPESVNTDEPDIVFLSTPDQVGMRLVKKFYDKKIPVIDFSGDFRFNTVQDYETYALNKGMSPVHLAQGLLAEAVYGLPEKNHDKILNAPVIGNPGCFAIAMILALLPAVENGLLAGETIICDGKTGVSGAGINPGRDNSYSLRYENANTYREGRHQHMVEVENIINLFGGTDYRKILFVPQIVPMARGILMTVYADVDNRIESPDVADLYRKYYKDSPFITVSDTSPNTFEVRGTNRCVIKTQVDKRSGKLLLISAIDNLMKGQSGNAVQNANIRLGLNQDMGLKLIPFYP